MKIEIEFSTDFYFTNSNLMRNNFN